MANFAGTCTSDNKGLLLLLLLLLKKASVSTQLKSVYTTESFESCQYVITRMQICCGMATYSILSRSVQTRCYDKKWDPCKYRISFPALDRTRGLLLDR